VTVVLIEHDSQALGVWTAMLRVLLLISVAVGCASSAHAAVQANRWGPESMLIASADPVAVGDYKVLCMVVLV
jgi:hypothetical protein